MTNSQADKLAALLKWCNSKRATVPTTRLGDLIKEVRPQVSKKRLTEKMSEDLKNVLPIAFQSPPPHDEFIEYAKTRDEALKKAVNELEKVEQGEGRRWLYDILSNMNWWTRVDDERPCVVRVRDTTKSVCWFAALQIVLEDWDIPDNTWGLLIREAATDSTCAGWWMDDFRDSSAVLEAMTVEDYELVTSK